MFNPCVNAACINKTFTKPRIQGVPADDIHPVTKRLYEAVRVLVRSEDMPLPSRVASEANISQQTLKHWESRGPSAQGLLDFQLAHGVNATWLLTGYGPLMVGGPAPAKGHHRNVPAEEPPGRYDAWPLSPALLARLAAIDPEERRRVENGVRGQLDMPLLASAGNTDAA